MRRSQTARLYILLALPLAAYAAWPFAGTQANILATKSPNRPSKSQVIADGHEGEWIEQISWNPRAYIYHNFLTEEQCDSLVEMAKPQMTRSSVIAHNGSAGIDEIRTSYGMFIRRLDSPLVTGVEEKLAAWTRLPLVNQEDMQILRYGIGQKYGAHYDSLDNDSPRIATVLIYLKDKNLTGGETAFPQNSKWIGGGEGKGIDFSDCAKGHVAAYAKKRDALLFYSLKADGMHDSHSMHTGCPVVSGIKWTATKWIHTKPFRPEGLGAAIPYNKPPSDLCLDLNADCNKWAENGECDKNPGYMKGTTPGVGGSCMRACKVCEPCKENDIPCRNRNRAKSGLLPVDAE